MGDEPPENFPLMEQSDLFDKEMVPNSFPEFEQYSFEEGDGTEKGIMDKVLNVIDNAYYNGLHYKEIAKSELRKSGLIEKIKEGTKLTFENMKTKGMNLYENSKPLLNDFKEKAFLGMNSIKEKTGNVIFFIFFIII